MGKKILFDLEAAQFSEKGDPHGGGEYATAVFNQVALTNRCDNITAFYNPLKQFDPKLRVLAEKVNIKLLEVRNKNELKKLLNPDYFHKFYSALPYKYYDLDFSGLQVIFTIHGLRGVEREKGYFPSRANAAWWVTRRLLNRLIKPTLKRNEKMKIKKLVDIVCNNITIIVPSMHTKHTLINTLPELKGSDIRVLYSPTPKLPFVSIKSDCEEVLKSLGLKSRQYFLLVNANRPVKNVQFALKALDNVFSRFPSLKRDVLVLGAEPEYPRFDGFQNIDIFKVMGYIERYELECVYQSAYAFIYPSLHEGFGYPPLECMRSGTPVLCSVNSSMAELFNGAVLFFNPFLIEELEIRITTILQERTVWEECASRGLTRYQEISNRQNRDLEELVSIILS